MTRDPADEIEEINKVLSAWDYDEFEQVAEEAYAWKEPDSDGTLLPKSTVHARDCTDCFSSVDRPLKPWEIIALIGSIPLCALVTVLMIRYMNLGLM